AQEPDVIFLDEPANHLDLKMQTALAEHLKKWVSDGKSVVGVFHDLGFAAAVSDRIMLIKDGKAILCGETREVLCSEELNEVFGTDVRTYMRKIADIWK
ncbi:MAG: ABC transporter ATP-binding protein, partial [Oscillospiraceae bacterium]|nr:ABC transporter ATP-binding protein [Oscillospiraceae bacterium]